MRRFLLFAVGSVLAVAQDWRFAHPGATLVGGIRPQSILNSPLVSAAIEEAAKKDPSAAAMASMVRGLLIGIREIRFSVLDNGTPEPDVIVLISGDLDEAMVTTLAEGKAKVKRIGTDTVLLGNGPSLNEAALRLAAPETPVPDLVQPDALADKDFWFAGSIPKSAALVNVLNANALSQPPKRRNVVVQGLDGGDREIPLEQRR